MSMMMIIMGEKKICWMCLIIWLGFKKFTFMKFIHSFIACMCTFAKEVDIFSVNNIYSCLFWLKLMDTRPNQFFKKNKTNDTMFREYMHIHTHKTCTHSNNAEKKRNSNTRLSFSFFFNLISCVFIFGGCICLFVL